VRDVRPDVDEMWSPRERVQVLRKALPIPGQSRRQRLARNVLDALHEADQPVVAIRSRRRETHPAVADDERRHPVPARRREDRIPQRLPVVVGVDVDEPGRDEEATRVDHLSGPPGD
jgi:hypothetical protein